jgi:hypothetical protein
MVHVSVQAAKLRAQAREVYWRSRWRQLWRQEREARRRVYWRMVWEWWRWQREQRWAQPAPAVK